MTLAEILAKIGIVKNETITDANTASRVGQALEDLAKYIPTTNETNASIAKIINDSTDQGAVAPADTDVLNLGKGLSSNKWSILNFKNWLSTLYLKLDQIVPQSIGTSLKRLTKLWATDAEFTNMPTVGGNPMIGTGAQTLTTIQQDQIRVNTGTASSLEVRYTTSSAGNKFVKEAYISGSGVNPAKIYYISTVCRQHVTYQNGIQVTEANPDFSNPVQVIDFINKTELSLSGVIACSNVAGTITLKIILNWDVILIGTRTLNLQFIFNTLSYKLENSPTIYSNVNTNNILTNTTSIADLNIVLANKTYLKTFDKVGSKFIKEAYISGTGINPAKIYYISLVCRQHATYDTGIQVTEAKQDFSIPATIIDNIFKTEAVMSGIITLTNTAKTISLQLLLDWEAFIIGSNSGGTLKFVFNELAYKIENSPTIYSYVNISNAAGNATLIPGISTVLANKTFLKTFDQTAGIFIKEAYISGSGINPAKIYYLSLVARQHATYGNSIYFTEANPDFSSPVTILSVSNRTETSLSGIITLINTAKTISLQLLLDWEAFIIGSNSGGSLKYVFNELAYKIENAPAIYTSINISSIGVPRLTIPSNIYAVVGYELNLFYDALILGTDSGIKSPKEYGVEIICAKGLSKERNWSLTPLIADIGTTVLTVNIYNSNHIVIQTKTVNLVVISATPPTSVKNVVNIGDSLTGNTPITQTIRDNFVSLGSNIPIFRGFIGTSPNNHQGAGGWAFKDYSGVGRNFYKFITSGATTGVFGSIYSNNGSQFTVREVYLVSGTGYIKFERTTGSTSPSASGVLTKISGGGGDSTFSYSAVTLEAGNPLWNTTTGALDIANYRNNLQMGVSKFDGITIQLGINESIGDVKTETDRLAVIGYAKSIIDAFLADNSATKIIIELPTTDCNTRGGWAANYGATGQKFTYQLNVWRLRELIISNFDNGLYNANVSIGIAGLTTDRYYAYERITQQISVRITEMEEVHINAVHPGSEGGKQMGDGIFPQLLKMLQ